MFEHQGLFVARCCVVAFVCKTGSHHPEASDVVNLIKMLVYRKGVTDVLHVTKEEVKRTRQRLASEEWTIYHTELI